MKKRQYAIITAILGSILLLALIPGKQVGLVFHDADEYQQYRLLSESIPIDSSIIFPVATLCAGCHGHDTLKYGMVTEAGLDVNVYDDWESSMMANSAKDPFWRAKVSHEILVNPEHRMQLETKCTSCHAPQGHFTAILRGADFYTMEQLLNDTIGLDGVSCAACHTISTENLGRQFSGNLSFDTSRIMFGPYQEPFLGPMEDFVGFRPVYSDHINDAGLCAGCHTLITESVDLDGNPTGESFVEQATYHEWLNSVYDDEDKVTQPVTCQECHIPRIEEEIVISANYLFLEGRTPYGLHDLVGGNTMMLKLMRDNREALGITAAEESFEETIAKTMTMLQDKTLDLDVALDGMDPDSLYLSVLLKNKAGHKFPSGYPSRRAFIEFLAITEAGDTLFKSGVMDSDFEVFGQENETVPHFQLINEEHEVQIYELVLGDIEGNFTTVLERAYAPLKDNRLVPVGFKKSHASYDTTRIVGHAESDPDFNRNNSIEGTGTDRIAYHFPKQGYTGYIDVSVRVYYQSLPPRWMEEMFNENTPEIDTFRDMYYAADRSPVLIAEQVIEDIFVDPGTAVKEVSIAGIEVYPNPSTGQELTIRYPDHLKINRVLMYNSLGQFVGETQLNGNALTLPEATGMLYLLFDSSDGLYIEKILRL